MGDAPYQVMLKNWQTESGLTEEQGILHASGCKAQSCSDVAFELFIDPTGDNVNVYAISGKALNKYEEKGAIKLTPAMASNLAAVKGDAGVN